MAVVILVIGSRIVLSLLGGQFFFPDEARYSVSRDAAGLIVEGKWREGLALPFEGGDHVGFKFLGVVPALAERAFGRTPWLPGIFWSLFSAASVLGVGLLARRLGGSDRAQMWCLFAAATSTTLFYYSRHLLPYDASMCLALASLYVATGGTSLGRAWGAGVLAGMAFAIYYGYWPLVGVVLVWGTLHGWVSWLRCVARGASAALGAGGVVVAAWGINTAWGSGQMFERAWAFSGTINQGDYRASLETWTFLLRAEGAWALVALALSAWMVWRWRRCPPAWRRTVAPGLWAVIAVAAIWVLFVVTGDVMHKFTVYGRLIRQMTPFLSLALGFGAAAWLAAKPVFWPRLFAGLLVVNAAWLMGQSYVIRFPGEFYRRWEPLVAVSQREKAEPGTYYRFVNATRYFHEIEVLREPPLETLVAVRHPFSFAPYLYELFGSAERERRRAVDHRLRVVKMRVQPAATVQGEAYGLTTLRVRFQNGRPGFSQPLLSVGARNQGELFFVQYLTDTRVRLGCEVIGRPPVFSEALDIDPAQVYEIGCFSGGMLPPGDAEEAAGRIIQLSITLDGCELIRRVMPKPSGLPAQVYAGVNVVNAPSAGEAFAGEILSVVRGGFPAASDQSKQYGAVQLRLGPPIPGGSQPEPLVVVGQPGRAVLGFIVPLPDGLVRFGVEVWGTGAYLSEPVRLRGDDADDVIFEFGSLFPAEGDPMWGNVPSLEQTARKHRIRVWLNGLPLLEESVPTPEFDPTAVAIGKNPVGGSYVGKAYSGQVLMVKRLGLQTSEPDPER